MSVYAKFHKSITSYFQTLQEQYGAKYVKEIALALVLLVAFGGGYLLRFMYIKGREERAYVAFCEVLESLNQTQQAVQALDPEKDHEKLKQAWKDTLVLLDALYAENSSSYLAPYFLAFKSQIEFEQNHNLDESLRLLDEAIALMPSNTELTAIFQLKRIKMRFDVADQQVRQQALVDLIEITKNSAHFAYEEALYLLGIYYIAQGDTQKAQDAFQKLVARKDTQSLIQSPWIQLAEEKLGYSHPTTDIE